MRGKRGLRILLVERSSRLAFAGGATVFPGGKVDPADRALAVHEMARKARRRGLDPEDVAGRIAAVRETGENRLAGRAGRREPEAALHGGFGPGRASDAGGGRGRAGAGACPVWLVARSRRAGALGPLVAARQAGADLRHAVLSGRSGTGAVDLAVDGTENRRLFWASARDALALADKGAIHIIYPTRRNLERLADFPDFAACRAYAQTIPVVPISPRMVLREGCRVADDSARPALRFLANRCEGQSATECHADARWTCIHNREYGRAGLNQSG
jgi:hypothetical protein